MAEVGGHASMRVFCDKLVHHAHDVVTARVGISICEQERITGRTDSLEDGRGVFCRFLFKRYGMVSDEESAREVQPEFRL